MGDRRDYYFRQKVTEAELDVGFNGLEQADFDQSVDHDLVGIVNGMGVSEKSGTPDLTVDVAGPGAAYSKQGERISFSSLQNVDLSVDDGSVSTAVATPGNSRVIALFITFDRLLSDPRIDGNSVTVFFQRDESFAFSVVAGAEAATGTEVPPALDPNKILLADVTLDFGQTQILNADIAVTRREDAYRLTGTVPIVAGSPLDAVTALLAGLNNHIDGAANKHPAADVTYAGSGNWANATPLTGPPTETEAAIDQVVADLASSVTVGGSDRIGALAAASGGESVAAGALSAQILAILASADTKVSQSVADTITAVKTMGAGGFIDVGTAQTGAGLRGVSGRARAQELIEDARSADSMIAALRAGNYNITTDVSGISILINAALDPTAATFVATATGDAHQIILGSSPLNQGSPIPGTGMILRTRVGVTALDTWLDAGWGPKFVVSNAIQTLPQGDAHQLGSLLTPNAILDAAAIIDAGNITATVVGGFGLNSAGGTGTSLSGNDIIVEFDHVIGASENQVIQATVDHSAAGGVAIATVAQNTTSQAAVRLLDFAGATIALGSAGSIYRVHVSRQILGN